jgi:hypothetical protein
MLTVVAEAGTQGWYGYHEARAAKAQPWGVAWPKEARGWKEVPIADQAQELLRYNEGGGGAWVGPDGHHWTMYFFKWLPGRTAGLFIKNHRPDVCLPASGMTLRGGVQNKLMEVNGVKLPIRSYVFENGPTLLHVYYCYWDGSPPRAPRRIRKTGRHPAEWTLSAMVSATSARRCSSSWPRATKPKLKPRKPCARNWRSSFAPSSRDCARVDSRFLESPPGRILAFMNWTCSRLLVAAVSLLIAAKLPAQTPVPSSGQSGASVNVAFWNIKWFPGGRPSASPNEEARQVRAVHEDIPKLAADVIGFEEVRDWESAALAVKPLARFKVDVCSTVPAREGQTETQQVAIVSRLQPMSAWAEEWKSDGAITPPRGFAFAAYEIAPKRLLLVYAVHLKSNRGSWWRTSPFAKNQCGNSSFT